MMSNTCSQLHMCNMYNTLMKYAQMQGRKKPKNQFHTSSQLYVQDVYNTLMKHADFEGKKK